MEEELLGDPSWTGLIQSSEGETEHLDGKEQACVAHIKGNATHAMQLARLKAAGPQSVCTVDDDELLEAITNYLSNG